MSFHLSLFADLALLPALALLLGACGSHVVAGSGGATGGGTTGGGGVGGTGTGTGVGATTGAAGDQGGATVTQACPPGLTDCNGECVDLQSDFQNCASCGHYCEGGCQNGQCLPGTTTIDCPGGYAICFGQCVDLYSDPFNCGDCGNACGDGAQCVDGSCESMGCVGCATYITDAGPGQMLCPGQSTDLYDALATCTCAGNCAMACGDNVCMGMSASPECQSCVTGATGCEMEFDACANDF